LRDYKVKSIAALGRGIDVLLALQDRRVASLQDLHQQTGLSKSTLIRILHTLHRKGLVWQRMADGAFLASHRLRSHVEVNDVDWLVENAAPILETLCRQVSWPSVLSVPKDDHMAVIETNSPRASFDLIVGPIGAKIDMLRSSSGRAFLAFCDAEQRATVLRRLRASVSPAPRTAWDDGWIERIIATTRQRGYGVRADDYVGLYNDDRASLAMPVIVTGTVLCCINLTWRAKLLSVEEIANLHIDHLRDAVRLLETKLLASLESFTR
jgi:IclR family mhp operon transcriptional activator